jgi:hypothetical protein
MPRHGTWHTVPPWYERPLKPNRHKQWGSQLLGFETSPIVCYSAEYNVCLSVQVRAWQLLGFETSPIVWYSAQYNVCLSVQVRTWQLLGFETSPVVWYSAEYNVCLSVQVRAWQTPALMGPLEGANLNHWIFNPVSETLCWLEYWTMDKVQKPINPSVMHIDYWWESHWESDH